MPQEYIKPCPFCGNTRVEVARTNPGACWIKCDQETGCGAEAKSDPSREGAIANWNQRAVDTGEVATVVHDMELPRDERIAHYRANLIS